MGSQRNDEIALIEAIYDLAAAPTTWIRNVCGRVQRNLEADVGVIATRAWAKNGVARGFGVSPLLVDAPNDLLGPGPFTALSAPDPTIRRRLREHPLSGYQESFPAHHPYRRHCDPLMARVGASDNVAFVAFDGTDGALTIASFFTRKWAGSKATRRRYHLIAKHLAVGARLRGVFAPPDSAAVGDKTCLDAIFEPSGWCREAYHSAQDPGLLDELRTAVRDRERARSSLRRRDPDAALGLWKELACGRWSLVDRHESDGRRFILAVRNEPDVLDPRALTAREIDVVVRAGRGASNKEIGYDLGLSEGCASTHLHAAYRKLGCAGRADLIRMTRSTNEEMAIDLRDATFGVIMQPTVAGASLPLENPELTPSERAVLRDIRAGRTNAEIAHDRGVAVRTVANQVASILRKTSRTSRFELMLD